MCSGEANSGRLSEEGKREGAYRYAANTKGMNG